MATRVSLPGGKHAQIAVFIFTVSNPQRTRSTHHEQGLYVEELCFPLCVHVPWRPEDPLELQFRGDCESPSVGVGHPAWVLCKTAHTEPSLQHPHRKKNFFLNLVWRKSALCLSFIFIILKNRIENKYRHRFSLSHRRVRRTNSRRRLARSR